MNKAFEGLMVGMLVVFVGALALLVTPMLAVVIGWIGGTAIKLLFGTYITNGLNLLFDTTRFNPQSIPMFCSVLAVIGSYFKSVNTSSK